MKPVYYGRHGTDKKCPDYQGVLIYQVILYDKVQFGTSAKRLDYAGVCIVFSSVHINGFHSTKKKERNRSIIPKYKRCGSPLKIPTTGTKGSSMWLGGKNGGCLFF